MTSPKPLTCENAAKCTPKCVRSKACAAAYARGWYAAVRKSGMESSRTYISCIICDRTRLRGGTDKGEFITCIECRKKEKPPMRKGTSRMRARALGLETEPYRRRDIAERDGWTCGICALPVEDEPRAWHVGHVIPISRGGPDIASNLQLAHAACNLKKGAR